MSHWFTVKTRLISESAIKKAADKMGFMVRHRTKCRGWGGQQKECDLVLKLNDGYDVGFQKQADGSFTVVADFWSDHISKYLADPEVLAKAEEIYPSILKEKGEEEAEALLNDAKISRFMREYSYFLVEEIAQEQGLIYLDQKTTADGSIRVELTGEPYLTGVTI